MPGNRKETMDTREMLRRLRKGQSNRAIAKAMKANRKTESRYRIWATRQVLGAVPLCPSWSQLRLADDRSQDIPERAMHPIGLGVTLFH